MTQTKSHFFSHTKTAEKDVPISMEQIVDLFQLEPNNVISCKKGTCRSIEIRTPDLKTAIQLEQIFRKKLESEGRKYGGLIRYFGGKEPVVEINFDALDKLKNLLKQDSNASAAP